MADRDIILQVLKLEAANSYVYEEILKRLPSRTDNLRYTLMHLRDQERGHVAMILEAFPELAGNLEDFSVTGDSPVESGLTVAQVLGKYMSLFTGVDDDNFLSVATAMEQHAARFFQDNMPRLSTPRARQLLQKLIDLEAEHQEALENL